MMIRKIYFTYFGFIFLKYTKQILSKQANGLVAHTYTITYIWRSFCFFLNNGISPARNEMNGPMRIKTEIQVISIKKPRFSPQCGCAHGPTSLSFSLVSHGYQIMDSYCYCVQMDNWLTLSLF